MTVYSQGINQSDSGTDNALPGGHQAELAGRSAPDDWVRAARSLLGMSGEPIVLGDRSRGLVRLAFVEGGRLKAALCAAAEPVALWRSHGAAAPGSACGLEILAGRPGAGQSDPGATVCAGYGVGRTTIRQAIANRDLSEVEAIGSCLGAGTNCGSCRPELGARLAEAAAPA